jgi:hypothetical protein
MIRNKWREQADKSSPDDGPVTSAPDLTLNYFSRRGDPMIRQDGVPLATLLLASILVTFQTTGCGTSNPNRALQSISVAPATADAQSFPNGQVQFTATGTFSRPPSPAPVPFVAPYSGSWLTSDTTVATISQSGVAQCRMGASGTVTVTAIASANSCPNMGCMSIAVSGTAKLACP